MARDSTVAVLFPGQGSQTPDMRKLVESERPDLMAEVGPELFDRAGEGTRWAQPAIFCASLAGWSRLDVSPDLMAGHSLGEISALVAAGALAEPDGLRLVIERGRLMQEAAEAAGEGGMLAALGDDRDAIDEIARRRRELTIANDNAPTQVVLSGPVADIDDAETELKERGLRARRLTVQGASRPPVRGAFHSPAMERVVQPFRELLEDVEVREPRVTVLSGVTAEPFDD